MRHIELLGVLLRTPSIDLSLHLLALNTAWTCALHFLSRSLASHIWVATPSACYRGPTPQKCPKWLGEGAKGVLDPRSEGLPRVFCTTKTLFCTGATFFCTSARGLWRPWPKGPFAPSPNHFWEFPFSGPLPGPLGRNIWEHFAEPIPFSRSEKKNFLPDQCHRCLLPSTGKLHHKLRWEPQLLCPPLVVSPLGPTPLLESISVHPVYRNPPMGLLRTFWEPGWVLRSPLRGFLYSGCPQLHYKKSASVHPVHGNPRSSGPSKNLLGTRLGS